MNLPRNFPGVSRICGLPDSPVTVLCFTHPAPAKTGGIPVRFPVKCLSNYIIHGKDAYEISAVH